MLIPAYTKNNANIIFKYLFGIFVSNFAPIIPPITPPIAHFIPIFQCIKLFFP